MVRIRFFRVGRKKKPFYKIVVTDKSNAPSGGRFIEEIGYYDPSTKESEVNKERVLYWIGQGASPSDTMHNFLIKKEIIRGKKVGVHSTSKKEQPSEKVPEEETKPVEEKPAEEVKEETTTPEEKKAEPQEESVPAETEPVEEEKKEE